EPGVKGARRLAAPCRSPAEANLKLPGLPGERNLLIARSRSEQRQLQHRTSARSRSEQRQLQHRTPARSRSEQSQP
ncbi:hypothetical protein WKH24_19400, partial [Pantoea agglomerans]|uniref:hypothetical protein n=1 Tax=Enterobacter agglomerans TaxID=549 RepID=UPI003C7C82C7